MPYTVHMHVCVCKLHTVQDLTIHSHLVPRLRMHAAQHLIPLYAFMDYIATPLPLPFT